MGRRRSNRNVCLYKLSENFESLESIHSLADQTKVDLRISEKDKKKLPQMSDDFLSLSRSWQKDPIDADRAYSIKIPNITGSGKKEKTVLFLHRTVNVERQHNQMWKNKNHTQLLPRESFVFTDFTDVLFINVDETVYVAIFTSDETRIDQIIQLIGSDNIEDTDLLEDNFFAWMFWKYDRNNRQINSKIGLPAMNAFSGTIQRDDLQDMIIGRSPNITDLSVLKMHIARQFPLRSVGMELTERKNKLYFKVDVHNQIVVDTRKSKIVSEGITDSVLVDLKEYPLIVYIYTYIIPLLNSLYEKEEPNFTEQLNSYSKDLAKEIMLDLMGATGIKPQDLDKTLI